MTHVAAVKAAPAASPVPSSASLSTLLQRKCACGGEAGFDGTCKECRKETLQRKVNNGFAASATPPIVHSALRSPGRPLDPATRAVFEARLGHNFGRVRVHADAHAGASAKAVNALAYTVGEHVVFAPGRFRPQDSEGRLLLGHELAHVVQQSAAGIGPPTSEAALEAEADGAAAAAERGGRGSVMHRVAPHLLRQEEAGDPQPKPAKKSRDLVGIAARVRKAIKGLGTDEEAVYAALQELDRDPEAIQQLMEIYKARYPLTLIDDIRDDFSGEELEYALQFLNLGDPGSAQRIDDSAALQRQNGRRQNPRGGRNRRYRRGSDLCGATAVPGRHARRPARL